jgi:hypothetical protein
LAISTVFDFRFAESLGCRPSAISASDLALQFHPGVLANADAFRKALCRNGILRGLCILRRRIRCSLKQFKFRTIKY